MRSTYSIKLVLLLNSRIRVERVNLFRLKFNLSITLNNILLASSNFLLSRNTQDLSNTYNNNAIKLKRNRIYFNKKDSKYIASFVN